MLRWVPFLVVAGAGAGECPPVSGDAPSPLGGDAILTKAHLLLRVKAPLVIRLQTKVHGEDSATVATPGHW